MTTTYEQQRVLHDEALSDQIPDQWAQDRQHRRFQYSIHGLPGLALLSFRINCSMS